MPSTSNKAPQLASSGRQAPEAKGASRPRDPLVPSFDVRATRKVTCAGLSTTTSDVLIGKMWGNSCFRAIH